MRGFGRCDTPPHIVKENFWEAQWLSLAYSGFSSMPSNCVYIYIYPCTRTCTVILEYSFIHGSIYVVSTENVLYSLTCRLAYTYLKYSKCLLAPFPCNPTWRLFSVLFGILCQVFVLYKWYWMPQSHTPGSHSSMYRQNSIEGQPENSLQNLSGLFALNAQNILLEINVMRQKGSTYRGLWVLVVVWLLWLSVRTLAS